MRAAYHVTPVENLVSILERGLQPRIGERSAELGEQAPRVYLFSSRDACDNALANWLGECFDYLPEDGLVILEIDVTGLVLESAVEYELVCYEAITPSRIVDVMDEGWERIAEVCTQSFSPMRMG